MTKGKSRMSGRKALSNISNIQQGFKASNQDHNTGPSSDVLRRHIEQLQKEKEALMKHLADKNKVIELSGIEIQKLRVTLEKVKQQNLQLAQSNCQMLAELNSVKERQKLLNHELGCKNGLIIAKNLELEGKNKTRMCQADDIDHNMVAEPEEIEVCPEADGDDDKHYTRSRGQISKTEPEEIEVCPEADSDDDKHYTRSRRQISKSLIHSNEKIQDNDKGKSKRLQKRRQSAKFKLDEHKPTEDYDVPPCSLPHDDDDKMKVNDSIVGRSSSSSSSKQEDKEGDSFQDHNKPQEHRKTSLSRPVREAAKKVQSYKEVNLVVKMRRE
ncbi:hypothetical protein SSX86_017940 [Deinandra increscens subsp. villosa]